MAINHLESIKMRVYVLLLTCLFFSLLGKPQQPRMMYEDTSRRGVPFSKDPHVVNFQGRYLMYYTLPPRLDVSGSGANIGIASSKDLVNWSKVGEITPEKNAVYEKNGLCAPGALVRDGKIHLFYQTYGNGKPGEWNSSESGHPHLFTDLDGRTYLFYQGNNDHGKTWYITQQEVLWKDGKPYLK